MTDVIATTIVYGDGGFDPDKPNNNIVEHLTQTIDASGTPVGDPIVVFAADPAVE